MDVVRFDALVRTLGITTRRRGLRLLTGGALSSLLAVLRHEETAAACRQVGKPCNPDHKCCTGARCKGGRCKCKKTHFTCGTGCCLDGGTCGFFGDTRVCVLGPKEPGDACDPDEPGECTSGVCGAGIPGLTNTCRVADCQARQGLCDGPEDCCSGVCDAATTACGGGTRCCQWPGAGCQEDCDCCADTNSVCRQGGCCRREFDDCGASSPCCGDLVCHNYACLKP